VHEADEPDVVSDFAHADVLSCKDLTQVDLSPSEAQTTALRDDDGEIVEGIFERRQAAVGASRGLIAFVGWYCQAAACVARNKGISSQPAADMTERYNRLNDSTPCAALVIKGAL
jgi:hypothetical protein